MVRVGVLLSLALVACDSGASKPETHQPQQPVPAPVVADAMTVVDAAIAVEVEAPVDAMPLAPPKAAAAQKRDCAKIGKLHIGRTYSNDERREYDELLRKLCVETPWSATIVDCLLHTPKDGNHWDCFDQLPADQHAEFEKQSHESFCKYNDCIPANVRPMPAPSQGSDVDLDL